MFEDKLKFKKYLITIEVLDEKTGNIIGKRSTYIVGTAKNTINDVPEWIKKYDEDGKIQCLNCSKYFKEDELESVPDGDNEEKICSECLGRILYNHEKLN